MGKSLVAFVAVVTLGIGTNCARDSIKQKQSATCGTLQLIPGDVRTITPWSAAIFVERKTSGDEPKLKYFTNGIIIGPSSILSTAGGPYGATLRGAKSVAYKLPNPRHFVVGAGINSTDPSQYDKYAQFSRVVFIEPYRNHERENLLYHFLVYHLEKPLDLSTPYVNEICLPLSLRVAGQSPYGWQLVQGGFAQSLNRSSPAVLKAWKCTAGPKKTCESVFRYHYHQELEAAPTFCARRDVNKNIRGSPFANVVNSVDKGEADNNLCQLHGSSFSFALSNTWYLASYVSMIPGKGLGRCNARSFYMYNNALLHLDWIYRSYSCSPNYSCSDGTCVPLKNVCNGVQDCSDGSDEDELFCEAQNTCDWNRNSNRTHSCGIGDKCITKSQLCDGKPDCMNSNDEAPNFCGSRSKPRTRHLTLGNKESCPVVPRVEGAEMFCIDGGTNSTIPCHNARFPGNVVSMKCDAYHSPHFRHEMVQMSCEKGGLWLGQKPFACDRDCGRILNSYYRNAPWEVAIFKKFQGQKRLVCSATLLEASFIIAAASCITSWVTNNQERSSFEVLANPVTTDYILNFDSNEPRTLSIKNVWLSSEGDDSATGLALVKLQQAIAINRENRPIPACYLHLPIIPPPIGTIGKVSTFSLRNANVGKFSFATVVPMGECDKAGLTPGGGTTFCAVLGQGAEICENQTGIGFMVETTSEPPVTILKGVSVSSSPGVKCSSYAVFTSLDALSGWVLEVLEENS